MRFRRGGPVTDKIQIPEALTRERAYEIYGGSKRLVTSAVDYDFLRMQVVLDKLGPGTQKSYQSQYQWWERFCNRRSINPLRVVTGPSMAEENLMLDFVIHSGVVMGKSYGIIWHCEAQSLGHTEPTPSSRLA